MLRKLTATVLLLLLLPAGLATAHGGGSEGLYHQTVAVGPYQLVLDYVDWPMRAQKSNRIIVAPRGGITNKTGVMRLTAPGPDAKPRTHRLLPYPGLQDAWMFETAGLPLEGNWTMEFQVTGPDGQHVSAKQTLTVAEPPGIPMWFGWLIGLFPLYGLAWFGVREVRRVRRLTSA